MTLADLAPLAIRFCVALSLFGFGLQADFADEIAWFRRPGLVLRSVLAMNVVMFMVAVSAVLLFDLDRTLEVGLVALSLSPVPPAIPSRLVRAGATVSAAVRLVTSVSVLSIVVVPLGVAAAGFLAGRDLQMPIASVANAVLFGILVPLSIGIAFHHFVPRAAARIARPLQRVATFLLLLAAAVLLFKVWARVSAFDYGVVPALTLFSVCGLAVGHVLGGPNESNRTLLALVTSARHPGMVLVMAGNNYPDAEGVLAIVTSHLLISALVAAPYLAWRQYRRTRAGVDAIER